jgi:hypothetical protein
MIWEAFLALFFWPLVYLVLVYNPVFSSLLVTLFFIQN